MGLKILEEYALYSYYDEDGVCVAEYESVLNGYVVADKDNNIIRSFENKSEAEDYIKRK